MCFMKMRFLYEAFVFMQNITFISAVIQSIDIVFYVEID